MKLFQRLLVAPAALGLFSPLAANATEVNLNEIANYSDVESIEFSNPFDNDQSSDRSLLAGGEGLVDTNSYDGSFSETTTASFSVDFGLGYVDGLGLSAGVPVSGTDGTTSFTVPAGTSTFGFAFTSGDWDSEITYQVNWTDLDGSGSQTALSDGTSPAVGFKAMNICR